ncbi:MAG: hypothetical protein JST30_07175 [Armatimonadetes bacterium]|nr:hypothetical protein [Armatimonadota bacterium]
MSIPILFACLTLALPGLIAFVCICRQAKGLGAKTLECVACGLCWSALMVSAVWGAESSAAEKRRALQSELQSVAALFAQRIERLGHARVPTRARADDPDLLRLIEAERRWMADHADAESVYTVRRRPSGGYTFVVAAEADLDHDGFIKGDREARIAPGSDYEERPAEFAEAFARGSGFSRAPEADPWGVWVTATEALHAPDGRVEAILGVDFPAGEWTTLQERARLPFLFLGTVVTWLFLGTWAMTVRLRKEREVALERARMLARERDLLEQLADDETRLTEGSLLEEDRAA